VAIVAVVCVRLGFWQLERRAERAALNAGIEARMAEPPVELTRPPTDTAGWTYRRVSISGVPDADRAIVLPGRLYRGAPGAHVLVPVPQAGGSAVLVDLGWAPAADAASVALDSMRLGEPIDGNALIMPFPSGSSGANRGASADRADDGTFRRVWYAMDEQALRAQFPYELGAVQLQLLPSTTDPAYPVRMAAPPLDPGPHLGYAIQWFSFATIAVVGWLVMVGKSAGGRQPSRPATGE
jgi:surfeit locus 1 family protein